MDQEQYSRTGASTPVMLAFASNVFHICIIVFGIATAYLLYGVFFVWETLHPGTERVKLRCLGILTLLEMRCLQRLLLALFALWSYSGSRKLQAT